MMPFLPPLVAPDFFGVTHEWVTPKGTWELSDWRSGLMLDNRGIEGLHFPTIQKHESSSRVMHGKRIRGWRAEARSVFWPMQIWSDVSSEDWLARMREFFATIRPTQSGEWRVTVGDETRSLELTGVFQDSHAYQIDPVLEGWAMYGVEMEACQPFWRGERITRGPWTNGDPVPFFGDDGAPDFHISDGGSFARARIPNPGDVEAWPVWEIVGPLDPVRVGIGGVTITVPFPVLDGEMLIIDTDPRKVTATLNGRNVTRDIGFQSFAPVPPGDEVQVSVAAAGTGSVSASLVPLYFGAW